jgi:hypothetical protein
MSLITRGDVKFNTPAWRSLFKLGSQTAYPVHILKLPL